MFQTKSQNGVSLKAYVGSQMTLLAMNLDQKPADDTFAGFTIFYVNPSGQKNPIQNLLNFAGTPGVTGSDVSPIQAFKWVHFPGSYQQTGMLSGKYTYEATPRYLDNNKKLLPLDASKTVGVSVDVGDYVEGNFSVGFTRGFIKSQAFSTRYGAKQKLVPDGDWMFDTKQKAGTNPKFGDFTYEDMYAWLGFNARKMVYGLLEEALADTNISVDMFAYDFNDPGVAEMCLQLADKGRIRIILDNATLHHGPDKKTGKLPKEDQFETLFNGRAKAPAEMFRCKFGRFAHCKEIILKKGNNSYKVLTGSTNFSCTGLYVNANHVLVFDNVNVAKYYSDVFDACWKVGTATAFVKTTFANNVKNFVAAGLPPTDVNVSPHTLDYAGTLIDSITANVLDNNTRSVLFSVMDMGAKTSGSLIKALRGLHTNDAIYTYGITDNAEGNISLYKPGRKNGLLIDAKKANRELPPPFEKEFNLGLAHAVHHKFVVTNFNTPDARVYCGSSNLAQLGESVNGDNLLCIKDTDVATVFAIEAMRLTDHYNYRSIQDKADKTAVAGATQKPAKLDDTGKWFGRFFDPNDIRCVERELLA